MQKLPYIVLFIILLPIQLLGQDSWDQSFKQLQEQSSSNSTTAELINERYEQTLQLAIETYGKQHEAYVYTLIIGVRLAFNQETYQEGLSRAKEQLIYLPALELDYKYYANALYNTSQLYYVLDQIEEAIDFAKQYTDLLSLKESGSVQHALSKYEYANFLYINNDPLALEALKSSLNALNSHMAELGSQYLSNLYYLGTLHFEKEQYELSLEFYSRVLSICADNNLYNSQIWKSTAYNSASIYQSKKQLKLSIELYEQLKQQLEADAEVATEFYKSVANNLGVLYQKIGRSDGIALISSEGTDIQSRLNAAAIAFQKREFDKAIAAYNSAIDSISFTQFSDSLLFIKANAQKALVWKQKGQLDSSKHILLRLLTYPALVKAPENEEVIMVYKNLGDYYLSVREVDSASIMLNKAAFLADKTANVGNNLSFQINNSLGVLYQERALFKESKGFFKKNLNLVEGTFGITSKEYAQTLNNLGAIAIEESNYNNAEDYFLKAGEILFEIESDLSTKAELYKNLGIVAHGKTSYQKADSFYQKAAALYIAEYGAQHSSLQGIYSKIGLTQLSLGNYPAAEQNFRSVVKLATLNYGIESISYANAISSMGLYYQRTGNFLQAEKLVLEAIEIYKLRVGTGHPFYISAIENLSSIYQSEGKFEKALPLLQQALYADSVIYGINHPTYATTLHNIASVYLAKEAYALAKEMYQKALTIDREVYGIQSPIYASTLYNLAVLYQKTDQFTVADSLFNRVAQVRQLILGEKHPDYLYTLYGWGLLKQTIQEVDSAYVLLHEAVNSYLFLFKEYFPSMSESEKAAFYHKVNPVFEAYKDFALENYQRIDGLNEQLFDLQLNTKAMLLNASSKMRNKILRSDNQALIADFNSWQEKKELAVQYYSYTKEELEKEQVNLLELEEEINSMEKSLSLQSNSFTQAFNKDSLNWKAVQRQLPANTAVLELVRVKKSLKNDSIIYAGLLLTDISESPEIILLQNGKTVEERWFKAYQNLIKYKYTDTLSYDKLWKWVDAGIPNDLEKLYISPDGIYNKININTLYDKTLDEFVLEKENIRIISSARDLVENRVNANNQIDSMVTLPTLVLFGSPDFDLGLEQASLAQVGDIGLVRLFNGHIPPLPGTMKEVSAIDSLTSLKNWKVQKYTSAQATEIAIDAIISPTILHIASHGFFKNTEEGYSSLGMQSESAFSNPLLRSGLLLAGATIGISGGLPYKDSFEDGLLTAYETMNLNLEGTELVVLSACETGLGEVKNGEGVYGLQRAFMVAGAQNLIMSLWTVNDYTTQLLMTEFYRRWTQGEDKFTAFRNAQFKIKEEFPEPYYWAAFTIIGQ